MKKIGTKTLYTDRLILRKIKENDYKEAYKNWCSDENVSKYVMWNVHKNELETKELFSNWINDYKDLCCFRWIVEIKESKELIGTIDVVKLSEVNSRAEIGYCYGSKYWGNGYATEALKCVIDYLLNEVEIDLVVSSFEVSNPASGRVMEKAGMKCVGYLPKWVINKKGIREDLKYCIIERNNTHEMRLKETPFNSIKSGTKTIEMRLNDEKRKLLKVNDIIKFVNRSNNEVLKVKVIKLHKFNNFDNLYKAFDKISLGYKDNEIATPADMDLYYSKEEQLKYGVLGIEIELI